VNDSDAKLKFLLTAQAYGQTGLPVECVETHMSWVFLVGTRVYKLKKPVCFSFLDFSTLAAREHFCREEVRLNARLAPEVYLGVLALQRRDGQFALVADAQRHPHAETLDWLVVMRRLHRDQVLLQAIANRQVDEQVIDALACRLGSFYRAADVVDIGEANYLRSFHSAQAANRAVLLRPSFQIEGASQAMERLDAVLAQGAVLLRARVAEHRVRDGHGDLRPDHIFLTDPPVVIDCLEFNAQLRQVDPFDELAYLGLECAMAGAPWIGPRAMDQVSVALKDHPPPALVHLYTAHRALLRARLSMAHLLDPVPRSPDKWPPLARLYVARALRACDAFTSTR
jgi:aminoglycoside phosphotransferase family enzyme